MYFFATQAKPILGGAITFFARSFQEIFCESFINFSKLDILEMWTVFLGTDCMPLGF
jgi:hypothetical protein